MTTENSSLGRRGRRGCASGDDFLSYIATNGVPPDPLTTIPAVADAIAAKVENVLRSLVFGLPGLPAHCAGAGIPGVKVMVFNYYSFDHPDPQVDALLDLALSAFGASLRARVAGIQADITAAGRTARGGFVDTFAAMEGRQGLLMIDKRFGFTGGLQFEIHPTNAGHSVIAAEFAATWKMIQ